MNPRFRKESGVLFSLDRAPDFRRQTSSYNDKRSGGVPGLMTCPKKTVEANPTRSRHPTAGMATAHGVKVGPNRFRSHSLAAEYEGSSIGSAATATGATQALPRRATIIESRRYKHACALVLTRVRGRGTRAGLSGGDQIK